MPKLYEGRLTGPEQLKELLELESFLGGPRIDVIKRVADDPLFGEDGLPIRAKYVSERFKEAHAVNPNWKRMGQTEFLKTLADSVSGPVRWQKVVHGLQVEGLIDGGTPAEIGKIIRHIREDVRDECLDDVKDQLLAALRAAVRRSGDEGLPASGTRSGWLRALSSTGGRVRGWCSKSGRGGAVPQAGRRGRAPLEVAYVV